jgi:hypothetical protein
MSGPRRMSLAEARTDGVALGVPFAIFTGPASHVLLWEGRSGPFQCSRLADWQNGRRQNTAETAIRQNEFCSAYGTICTVQNVLQRISKAPLSLSHRSPRTLGPSNSGCPGRIGRARNSKGLGKKINRIKRPCSSPAPYRRGCLDCSVPFCCLNA